jgi:hypothetical protein
LYWLLANAGRYCDNSRNVQMPDESMDEMFRCNAAAKLRGRAVVDCSRLALAFAVTTSEGQVEPEHADA